MKYAIITNPSSGKMTADQKRSALSKAAEVLQAEIHGLDTTSPSQFAQCARELASRCDVLVIAGGDGTFSDVINAIDTSQTTIAYLPMGSGNALRHVLKYKGDMVYMSVRIKMGKIHYFDLIECDGKKLSLSASIGIEGKVLELRERYRSKNVTGFSSYLKALGGIYLRPYKRPAAQVIVDDNELYVPELFTLVVAKQPYYGYGMNVIPQARPGDGRLHVLCLNCHFLKALLGGITAFTIGNRVGLYQSGKQVRVKLDRPMLLQLDGNLAWEAKDFSFCVLPSALRIKY
ncbi:MAG: hypothetical protein JRI79_13260 [Deltaproteobacteria bacterium]|nr:hypothetical protein [Deltaproteobacteria bacterium]MBW1936082.1 hypothetical protein [Deltaproteobacteria bacterium]MBW1978915.1 hypothetical protein [Deltaproteobacteria bacterium]MBW2045849.1 hypothetical protein [Deltaproteobacteria bacterium]MBW2299752.1 hypothetical protein [Deltaproteobacteria bacterium]